MVTTSISWRERRLHTPLRGCIKVHHVLGCGIHHTPHWHIPIDTDMPVTYKSCGYSRLCTISNYKTEPDGIEAWPSMWCDCVSIHNACTIITNAYQAWSLQEISIIEMLIQKYDLRELLAQCHAPRAWYTIPRLWLMPSWHVITPETCTDHVADMGIEHASWVAC